MTATSRRVLFLRTDPGNNDPRILKEASSLARAGDDVSVFGWDRARSRPAEETIDGIRFRRSRVRAPYGSKLLLFLLPLYWVQAVAEARRIRPAVIHACDLDALVPALAAGRMTGARVVYDIFDHFADKISGVPGFVRAILRRIDASLSRRADFVIVTDEHRRSLLPDTGGVPVAVIMNVPPLRVSDPSAASPLRPRAGAAEGARALRLCYAGVIHEHRGLRLIAEAVEPLEGIETAFAGWIPREEDREFLQAHPKISYIGKLAYPDAITFMEESGIQLALYDPAVPINRIASSNKVFEAMSVGIPVISNRETTMAGIIGEVSCGLTVPYGDPAALREAIVRLRDDPALRAEMGENGRRAHRATYNWGIMERRLTDLYARLAPPPAGGGA